MQQMDIRVRSINLGPMRWSRGNPRMRLGRHKPSRNDLLFRGNTANGGEEKTAPRHFIRNVWSSYQYLNLGRFSCSSRSNYGDNPSANISATLRIPIYSSIAVL